MKYRLRNFFSNCYGFDLLNYLLLAASLLLAALGFWQDWLFCHLFASIALVELAFRALSHNVHRRWEENRRLRHLGRSFREALRGSRQRRKLRRDYRFFRCPGCGEYLRVPRGKGRIHITCPRCGQRFSGKT